MTKHTFRQERVRIEGIQRCAARQIIEAVLEEVLRFCSVFLEPFGLRFDVGLKKSRIAFVGAESVIAVVRRDSQGVNGNRIISGGKPKPNRAFKLRDCCGQFRNLVFAATEFWGAHAR